jgi:hypothetical protein
MRSHSLASNDWASASLKLAPCSSSPGRVTISLASNDSIHRRASGTGSASPAMVWRQSRPDWLNIHVASVKGMLVFSNIGPHPGHLKSCTTPESYLTLARDELIQLIDKLYEQSDAFVINLSSPNTAGLRGLLSDPRLTDDLVKPVHQHLQQLASKQQRSIPLLMKLPPDDPEKQAWTGATLRQVIEPLLKSNACEGFVAVNTSTRLTQQLLQARLWVASRVDHCFPSLSTASSCCVPSWVLRS